MQKQRGESGQSLVEFALVLPILALFLMGIIDFGRIIAADLLISEAARDGVRYASIGEADSSVGQVIQTDAAVLGNSVTWSISPTGSLTSGTTVTVTVNDTVSLFDPILASILGQQFTVHSSMEMRVE